MTPPTANPEARSPDQADPDATTLSDAATGTTAPDAAADAASEADTGQTARTRPVTKRRSASLELRVARKRAANANSDDDVSDGVEEKRVTTTANFAQGRGSKAQGSGRGTRAAAKAAQAEIVDETADTAAEPAAPVVSRADAIAAQRAIRLAEIEEMRARRTELQQRNAKAAALVRSEQASRVAKAVESLDIAADETSDAPNEVAADDGEARVAAGRAAVAEDVVRPRARARAQTQAKAPPASEGDLDFARDDLDDDDDDDADGQGRGGRRNGGKAKKRDAKATKTDAGSYVVAPAVGPARLRTRHYGVLAMFLLMVIMPTITYSWYLWTRAADQYESDVGFASRTEDSPSAFSFLGALGGSATSGGHDMDILNQFIISQELVKRIDMKLDLRAIFGKANADPLRRFDPKGTIEDLVNYWQKMVLLNYDATTGLMTLRIFSFDRQDSQNIAKAVLEESTAIINDLNVTSQNDATKYSKDNLQVAEEKLAVARAAVTDFQVKNRLVDPQSDVASTMSIVGNLTAQLAGTQIDLDMLTGTVADSDPRIAQLNRRIGVIRNRIHEEQSKVGAVSNDAPGYAKLVADFETLKADLDFSERAYMTALGAYDQAVADAQHKSAYLATFVTPTLAESSTSPNRMLSAALTALVGFLIWAVTVLIYYALRDRR